MEATDLAKEIADEVCRVMTATVGTPKWAMPLTRRQQQVVEFIIDYRAKNGISPTYVEIGEALDINKVTVFGMVQALEQKGHLTRIPGHARSIEVVAVTSRRDMSRLRQLAVEYERAKAG